MRRKLIGIGLLGVCLGTCLIWGMRGSAAGGGAPAVSASPAEQALARQILEATGVKGGLVVHLGCRDGKLTTALCAGDSYLVHGLDADGGNVEAARRHVQALGLYGKVSIDRCAGDKLPYIDNLVNLLVVEDRGSVPADEMLRVLAPNGVAYLKEGSLWTKLVKPRPKDIDEWPQYMHDASNNAVAHDAQVGPPRHLQWATGPNWSRHHDHMASLSALVSANGRVFYIMDEGPRESILLPSKWFLIARDAFNGTFLWKRPIEEWNTQLWPLKSGPNQLPRRLVAVGDRVYVTLGIDAPLTALDAATGRTVLTYAGTEHTDEVIALDGTLYALVAHQPNKWKQYRPKFTYVWDNTNRANKEWAWDEAPRTLVALDAQSGTTHWRTDATVAPLTLAADRDRVYFYDGEKVVSLNRQTGQPLWTSEPVVHKMPFPTGYGPTLVVQQGVVLVSVERPSMTAFSATDGKKLWTAPHHPGGHMSPDDMLVIKGLVWSADVATGTNSGLVTGRDIHTGEVKSEFPPDVNPPWFHHRCYRSRATDKYFIASRTGTEFIDLEAKHWDINHWVRGGCLYGFMPGNGLIYEPPQACGCFLESKLFAFNALAPESPSRQVPREVPDAGRLEQGPAYNLVIADFPAIGSDEWPTYRHDAARSGSVQTSLPVALKQCWQVQLGGRLSAPVAAGDKAFVAAIDAQTVYAIETNSGKPAWSYTAGGRVDSPPTIYQGRVLFGSADGWVYCLRADDGQLIWRFRAAPVDRRLIAFDQVESAWPVSGSVLVQNDQVYCVAGRSAFLDGGMRLVRLDIRTGRKLSETIMDERDSETGKNLQDKMVAQDMPVALPDILSCDGQSIYMRNQAFNLDGTRREVAPVKLAIGAARRRGEKIPTAEERTDVAPHLFSRTGFLDNSWFWRSYWIYGKAVNSNYGGWLQPGHYAPCGRLLVFDSQNIFGFDRKPEYLCNASVAEYYLYRADREVKEESVQRVRAATGRIDAASPNKSATSSDWAVRKQFPLTDQNAATFHWAAGNPPILARGLVLAGEVVFAAGPRIVVNDAEAFRNPDDPVIKSQLAEQAAAYEGRRGGQLLAISAADGKPLAAYDLGAAPVFDGMAAAKGKLLVATMDGRLLCLGGQGEAIPAAPKATLTSLDVSIHSAPPAPAEPAAEAGPSLAGEFAKVVQAQVTKSDLGYRLRGESKKTGFALKELPTPISGKATFKVRMSLGAKGGMRNGFLVFGEKPEDASLVKCGLRMAMKKAVIVQGAVTGGKTAEKPLEISVGKVYDIEVNVDLPAQQVRMKVDGATVTAKLAKAPASISYVGYGVIGAVTDFSDVDTSLN